MQQNFLYHYSFPGFFEVQFAEHIYNLISAILHNVPGCIEYWNELSNNTTNASATFRISIDKVNGEGNA